MSAIVKLEDARSGTPVRPAQWTAIVPAAGKGSRLGYHRPKILYPLLGRPTVAWLADVLAPLCARVVLVLAPDAVAQVEPVARQYLRTKLAVAVQPEPRGMGDAVQCAKDYVATPNALVVWGDQVTLRTATLEACMRVHQRPGATMTAPTIWRDEPYIHFERNAEGRLVRVLQRREGELQEAAGENDCGVFLFDTQALFRTLAEARQEGVGTGASTGEFNLLQVLPRFETGPGAVATVRITDASETLGVNTKEDVAAVERELSRRQQEST